VQKGRLKVEVDKDTARRSFRGTGWAYQPHDASVVDYALRACWVKGPVLGFRLVIDTTLVKEG
jgi:hypothetical protein